MIFNDIRNTLYRQPIYLSASIRILIVLVHPLNHHYLLVYFSQTIQWRVRFLQYLSLLPLVGDFHVFFSEIKKTNRETNQEYHIWQCYFETSILIQLKTNPASLPFSSMLNESDARSLRYDCLYSTTFKVKNTSNISYLQKTRQTFVSTTLNLIKQQWDETYIGILK